MSDRVTWRRRTARNEDDGVDLAVFEAGEPTRPTLVLVHGWPDTHLMWTGVAALLAEEFHVVAYDTRGQGESDEPDADEAYALPRLAADFRAVADEVSPDQSVHVLAHDWGSVEMWEVVCDPDLAPRVATFTSISGPSLDHLGAWGRKQVQARTPRGLLELAAQQVSSAYVPFFVSPLAPPAFRRMTRARWQRLLQLTEGIAPDDAHHAETLPHDMVSGLRRYRANLRRGLRSPQPRPTSVPVLQLVATRDTAIRRATLRCSDPYAERLTRVEVPYGHWLALSHPDVVAAETRRFIASHDHLAQDDRAQDDRLHD